MRFVVFIFMIALWPCVSHAETDEYKQYAPMILEKLEAGKSALVKKDLFKAANMFGEASNYTKLIRMKQLDYLLPAAPEGWVRKKKEDKDYLNDAQAGIMLGGMSMIRASYMNGDIEVEVGIVGDSPLMRSLLSMVKVAPDEAFSEYEKYKGGYLEYEESSYENQISIILVESATNVQIEGKDMTKAQGMKFAELMDFPAIIAAMKVKENEATSE